MKADNIQPKRRRSVVESSESDSQMHAKRKVCVLSITFSISLLMCDMFVENGYWEREEGLQTPTTNEEAEAL